MKKLILIAIGAGMMSTAGAQIYVQGGWNLANVTKTNSGTTSKNNTLSSFNAGVLGRFNLAGPIGIETGLLLDGRGSKTNTYFTSSNDDNYVKAKFNPLYVELPVNLVLSIPMQSTSNIFINAGPYIAMGVAGKSKVDTKTLGITTSSSSDIKFSSTDPTNTEGAYDELKRFDYGVNVGAGVDLGGFMIKANYGMGLAKISSKETNNSANEKNKYRTLSLSLGIPLSHK